MTRTAISRTARAAVLLGMITVAAACAEDPPSTRVAPPAVRTVAPVPDEPPTSAAPVAGPTVQEIVEALDAISPTRHPRDNTASCAAKAGCLGLITTGAVSVYRWPDASAATRFAGDGGAADRVGPYVLSYRTREQRSTPPQVRAAYREKVRELVGATE